jgi:hypothetical protein
MMSASVRLVSHPPLLSARGVLLGVLIPLVVLSVGFSRPARFRLTDYTVLVMSTISDLSQVYTLYVR